MKLTGPEIIRRVKTGTIVIDPFDENNVNPNSVDLRLDANMVLYATAPRVAPGPLLTRPKCGSCTLCNGNQNRRMPFSERTRLNWQQQRKPLELAQWDYVIDMKTDNPTYNLVIPEIGLVLVPGRLYLGQTVEYTETHDCVPCIEGRSSIGRLGISVHTTAGFGDVGFCGTWTLEISVVEPVRVYPGVRFCQISYDTVEGDIRKYVSTKYQGQRTPRPSRLWKELGGDHAALRKATASDT